MLNNECYLNSACLVSRFFKPTILAFITVNMVNHKWNDKAAALPFILLNIFVNVMAPFLQILDQNAYSNHLLSMPKYTHCDPSETKVNQFY